MKEIKILLFAVSVVFRKSSSFVILFLITLMVFILSSVLNTTESMKRQLYSTLEELPDITVQKISGGRQKDIPLNLVEEILEIPGVRSVLPRFWGYYYFDFSGINFTVMGIDPFEPQYKNSLSKLVDNSEIDILLKSDNWFLAGPGIKSIFKKIGYVTESYILDSKGEYLKLVPAGCFNEDTLPFSNEIFFVSKDVAKKILGIDEGFATDIVVNVYNKEELVLLASKIRGLSSGLRTVTKEDIRNSYANLFNYKSGIFLILFSILIFNMFFIVFDKMTSVSTEEKVQIGVLKTVGWKTGDVLRMKFYESFIISSLGVLVGLSGSLVYVYVLKAPILANMFAGYNVLKMKFYFPYSFDLKIFFTSVLGVIPFYISAVIIPSYRISITDTFEVFK